MEERRSGFNQDNQPREHSENEFLNRWLAKIEQPDSVESEEDEDDDSEEDKSSLPKRWKRFWKRLFKRIDNPEETSTRTAPLEYGPSLTGMFAEAKPSGDPADNTTERASATGPVAEKEHPAVFSGAENTAVDAMNEEQPHDTSANFAVLRHEAVTEESEPAAPEDTASAVSEPHETVEIRTRDEARFNRHEQVVFDRTHSAQEAGGRSRYESPRGAFAAAVGLIGAEHFGRKRADRRLKREIEQLQKRVRDGERASSQLKHLARESDYQQEQLHQRQKEFETELSVRSYQAAERTVIVPKPEVGSSRSETVPETQPVISKAEKNSEHTDASREEKTVSRVETAEKRSAEDYNQPEKPEVIFHKVVEAAEHDAPIERAYERRHEIKDDAGLPLGTASGPASIGSIMAQMDKPLSPQSVSSTQAVPEPHPRDITVRPPGQTMYDQAVQRGFWGGIIVIIFIVLLAVLY